MLVFLAGLILISPLPHMLVEAMGFQAGRGRPAQERHAGEAERGKEDVKKETEAEPAKAKEGEAKEGHEGSESGVAQFLLLLEKLGEALIIAAVLGFVVDEAVKKTLVEEILRDVLYHAVGYRLPDEVKEQVKYVLRLPFVRRNFQIHYKFRVIENLSADGTISNRYLEVTSTAKYDVENLTDTEKVFQFRRSIELFHARIPKENQLIAMEAPDLKIAGDELEKIAKVEGPFKKAELNSKIGSGKSGKAHFLTKRLAHYPVEHTMALDILEPPCIGISVSVDAPPALTVEAAFGVPGDVETSGTPSKTWTHPGVHLPGSHFRLSWKLDENLPAHSGSQA